MTYNYVIDACAGGSWRSHLSPLSKGDNRVGDFTCIAGVRGNTVELQGGSRRVGVDNRSDISCLPFQSIEIVRGHDGAVRGGDRHVCLRMTRDRFVVYDQNCGDTRSPAISGTEVVFKQKPETSLDRIEWLCKKGDHKEDFQATGMRVYLQVAL